jgi:hypothetical protein
MVMGFSFQTAGAGRIVSDLVATERIAKVTTEQENPLRLVIRR